MSLCGPGVVASRGALVGAAGYVAAQWIGCIYPRIARHLPAKMVLEIAPGYGRWTKYLLQHCDVLHGVNFSAAAVTKCRQRFGERRAFL